MANVRRIAMVLLLCVCTLLFVSASAQTASISGLVFVDGDSNGLYDGGEKPLEDAEVSLIALSGEQETVVATARTYGDGAFSFANLAAGNYKVRAILPGDVVFSKPAPGGSRAFPAAGQSSQTAVFTLEEGQAVSDFYIGASRLGAHVAVIAFGDENGNGGRFSSEPFIKDVQLQLLYEEGGQSYVVATATTNKEGQATMRGLSPATYRLAATLPDPYVVGPLGAKINAFYNCIVAVDKNYGVSEPFELGPKGSIGMGVGGVETGSITGTVWDDANYNGKQDAGEKGLAGAKLTLSHQTLGVQQQAVSAADGSYAFASLQAGSYTLAVQLPQGKMFTIPGDSLFSDGYSSQGSGTVQVNVRQETKVKPIGVMPITALDVYAFHDSNVNGVQDASEPPFAGAAVELLAGGKAVAKSVTDADGAAQFPIVRGGKISVRVTLPDQQVFTVDGGKEGNQFVSPAATSDMTLEWELPHATHGELKAGVTLPGTVAGVLYEDANSNGAYDEGEMPLAGFAVNALDSQQRVVGEAQTDENGKYQIKALIPGSYKVRILLKTPYVFSAVPEQGGKMASKFVRQLPEYGETEVITLAPGQRAGDVDGAVFRSAVLQGNVLLGDEAGGFAKGLGGLEGVRVELIGPDGQPVSDYTYAISDAQGHFTLKGALPGSYTLRYTLADKAAFSKPFLEEKTYETEALQVDAGDEVALEDVYAVKTGSISGQVFTDLDDDGVYSKADQPLAGARLNLENQSTESADDGSYTFAGIRPGSYTLSVQLPQGMLVGFAQQSPLPAALSPASSAPITLKMGEELTGQDIAAAPAQHLSGRVYFDVNLDRSAQADEAPRPGQEIRLRHELSKIEFKTQSAADGTYQIGLLYPGKYTISLPMDAGFELYAPQGAKQASGTWTLPAQLQAGEKQATIDLGVVQFGRIAGAVWNLGGGQEGVQGLNIQLLAEDGETAAQAVTDSQGAFAFEGLYPGSYSIQATIGDAYRFARSVDTAKHASVITSDQSEVKANVGLSAPLQLSMGEDKQGQDIGVGTTGKLGDFAWLDSDGDGMQDLGEPGVPGIVIRLYQYGTQVGEATTDPYGRYMFEELFPGEYTVEVTMPAELKSTKKQAEFPLVASVLPPSGGTVVTVEGIPVPSGGRNLNCDLGFALVKQNVLPEVLKNLPKKDWTPLVPYTPTR